MLREIPPIFKNIKEFNEIESLIDFVISINKLFRILDDSFTVNSFYGDSLNYIFQQILNSDTYLARKELLSSHINFKQVY
jgi:hypothetical protein